MKYFKNSELIRLYDVSDKAIRNWISSAQKNNTLKLHSSQGKTYIADTLYNRRIMDALVRNGRKYRNKRTNKVVAPTQEFYSLYKPEHVSNIINSLDVDRELPWDYTYFGAGGEYWSKYLDKLYEAGSGNILTNSIECIQINQTYLDALLESYEKVNIINLCPGNFLNARFLTHYLAKKKKLGKVVAVDISPTMLDISERNINTWFNGSISLEKCLKDIRHERFSDILIQDSDGENQNNTLNLILWLSGPIMNFKDTAHVLQTIRYSMGREDLLITSLKRDTLRSRDFFDFNIEADKKLLNEHDGLLLNLLNIEDSFYDVEQYFDPMEGLRRIQVRLKVDISLLFKINGYEKVVNLKKGESVLLVRVRHFSDQEIINEFLTAGFSLQLVAKSLDNEHTCLINKVQPVNTA